ncbi:MAG: hydrogenase 4 subunit B [bacterium]|nr:hydrogenase 4 subunit B [bacterium]
MPSILSASISFYLALSLLTVGAFSALLFGKNDKLANHFGNIFAILAGIFGLYSSLLVIISGRGFSVLLSTSFPVLNLGIKVDMLSAFFIFIISLISILASLYGIGYLKHYYKKYNIGVLGFFYNFFILGMLLVVSASNAIFFLIVWEIMSLASYFLVIFENKEEKNLTAGTLYFVMTHIGTAFITLAFLMLYSYIGSFDFAVIKAGMGSVPLLIKNMVFLCALIGFGTKAGMIPFHIWLPSAHPAAPTHVSALMSGVMIKTGVYMLIRLFADIIPVDQIWWGVVVLLIGAISACLGVLYALAEQDIKRLLAYSSIENIGIIFLGLGSMMIFLASNMHGLALFALVAALFHVFNHAIFKSLLFFGAGAVISQTHTRNMEEYGGLIKYMPQTAVFFLVGSLAISALPPFNGFFSEWMTFQSLFSGMNSLGTSVQWVFVLAAGALAFTGGLAAVCFVKAFGISFLARPRSEVVKHAKDPGINFRLAMAVLAVLALMVGMFAGPISLILTQVGNSISIFNTTETVFVSGSNLVSPSINLDGGFAIVSMPAILIVLVIVVFLVYLLVYLKTRKAKITIARTWDCGTDLNSRMEISATGFSRSVVTIFKGVLKPSKQATVEYSDASMRYFPKSNTIKFGTLDYYTVYFYRPVLNFVILISDKIKKIQSGNVNMYILYIFSILVILLVLLVI